MSVEPSSSQESLTAQSSQTRAEKQPQRDEELFAQVVDGVKDYAILLLDRHGHVLTWNSGAERIKGYRAEEIIGQHFARFYPNEAISSGWPAHELRMAETLGRFEDEGWRVRKDGSKFWANVVITLIRSEAGEPRGFLKITRDLTDRKQAEEKLRLSEERFRLIVEGVQDYAIFMLDQYGRVVTWNSGAQRLKGYEASEIIGQHFSRFYPQEAIDRCWPDEELRRAAAEGRFEDEGWRVRKDRSQFWASVVITALHDQSGTIRGFAKVTRDLTERKESEERTRRLLQEEAARKAVEQHVREIERQREELSVTLSSIGDAVIVTDMNGNVTFLNPVAAELTGWQPQEAAGQPLERVFRIINEYTRQPGDNPVPKVLREGVVVGLANHTILIAKNGSEIPIDDSGAPIRGEGGTIAGVVLVFRDVTEARCAMETRLHLAAIVESSDDAIVGKDMDGTITTWNRGAEQLYGYTADEIVGRPLSTLIPPDHRDEFPEIMERIRRGERVEHFETTRIRKDGTRVEVSLTISPIRNAAGRVIGASKIARDISARKEEDRRKNEFLALLAHELRNPLAALHNGLQVMSLAKDGSPVVGRMRDMMQRQLQQMVRLVDDLLDVSRISRGTIELRKRPIALSDVVKDALETCDALIREQDHQLMVAQPEEPVYVDADQTRLAQVLANLLNNAAKYTDRGGRIWLTIKREGDQAAIRVQDTGLGIPAAMIEKVFDLFTQVDRSLEKTHGGLGVGLTIVKRLVEMHGGSVEAHSAGSGRGSEFVVRLPALPDGVAVQPPMGGESTVDRITQFRILVVDDNVDAAATLSAILEMMDNDVRTAHDGAAAVNIAAEFQPDLILLDIGMPKLNGFDACRRIREQSWGQKPLIVAMTGFGQEEDRRRSRAAGFNGHLVKPIDPASLKALLANPKDGLG